MDRWIQIIATKKDPQNCSECHAHACVCYSALKSLPFPGFHDGMAKTGIFACIVSYAIILFTSLPRHSYFLRPDFCFAKFIPKTFSAITGVANIELLTLVEDRYGAFTFKLYFSVDMGQGFGECKNCWCNGCN